MFDALFREYKSLEGCSCQDVARACLAALEANGLVVVPVEPTEEMTIAGDQAICRLRDDTEAAQANLAYEWMLAAWARQ